MRPKREHATQNEQTYMLTTSTWGRRALFRNERWSQLSIDTLYHYRGMAYLLHEFVIMPDHIHVLLTPFTSLEKAAQFIKGGFSYRAKKELGSNMEVWQKGFQDHRIRDAADYDVHVAYIRNNPVRKHLCEAAADYPYSTAHAGFDLDDIPQGLKPSAMGAAGGAPEGAPFQNNGAVVVGAGVPETEGVQNNGTTIIGATVGAAEDTPPRSRVAKLDDDSPVKRAANSAPVTLNKDKIA